MVPRNTQSFPKPGQRVRVEGTAEPGYYYSPCINRAVLEVLGDAPLPRPSRKTFAELISEGGDTEWVESTGTVRSVAAHKSRVEMQIVSDQQRITLWARQFSGDERSLSRFLDAKVRITGVSVAEIGIDKNIKGMALLVSNLEDVAIEQAAAQEPFSLPLMPISNVTNLTESSSQRIRIQGTLSEFSPDGSLAIEDNTGLIRFRTRLSEDIRVGDRVDAAGFPVVERGVVLRDDAYLQTIAQPLSARVETALPSAPYLRLLTSAHAIRAMAPRELGRGYPVRLRGVVAYYNPEQASLYIQDTPAGICVDTLNRERFHLKHGQLVEVEGFSQPGHFAAMIVNARIKILGEVPSPTATKVSLDMLADGNFDSQWIETYGIVRSATNMSGGIVLDVRHAGVKTKVWASGSDWNRPITNLVDAGIRFKAISCMHYDAVSQLTESRLFVRSAAQIKLERLPASDPFDQPARPIAELFRAATPLESGHRIKASGTVTLQRLGRSLFVTDETGSLYVRTTQTNHFQSGDRIEVVGFPVRGDYAAHLEESIVRRMGSSDPPNPVVINKAKQIDRGHQFQLIRTEGRLVDHTVRPDERVLVVQSGDVTFPAIIDADRSRDSLNQLRVGSLLQLTGVCFLEFDSYPGTQRLRLLLRGPEDVVVLKSANWWKAAHTLWVLGGMGAGTAAVLRWAALLRRRVQEQTAVIREQLAHRATLEERYRELFEDASDLVYTHDLEGNYTSVNKACECTLAYSREEFLALNGFRVVAPESRELSRAMFAHKLSSGGQTTCELDYVAKDGHRVNMEVSTRLILENGRAAGVHGVARDITERPKAERRSALLSNLGCQLSAARTPRGAADVIIELARNLLGWDACYLHLFTPDPMTVIPVVDFDTIEGKRVTVPNDHYRNAPSSAMDLRVIQSLQNYGYRVWEAAIGAEAVGVWRTNAEHIDLLLTDITMPGGMSGFELAKVLVAEKPGLKVIFTSGYSQQPDHPPFTLREGINYLPKPYPLSKLAKMLRDCFDGVETISI